MSRSWKASGVSRFGTPLSAARRLAPTLAVVSELSEAELDALIAQATVDCYNEDEELAGFAVMIEDNLAVPFETTVLGLTVTSEYQYYEFVALDRPLIGKQRAELRSLSACAEITVTRFVKISQTESGVVAICVHGKHRQAIPILDLPLPDPPPQGVEWIAAYRRWAG